MRNSISVKGILKITRYVLLAFVLFLTASFVVENRSIVANDTVSDSLDIQIGQMLLMGISDRKSLSDSDRLISELQAGKMGGIVLFEKNISSTDSRNTLSKLITDLQKHSSIPLWISIDEEGGKVHRLKEKYGFVAMPSAAYLGKLNHPDSTYFYYYRLAMQLQQIGINLNFAPSVDLAVNPENKVIVRNMRSFSFDADAVTMHAKACVFAHRAAGVATVLKHFPGHGSSTGDSHLGIVDVSKTWTDKELLPFKNLIDSNACDAVMTAHIIHQGRDTFPATLSYVSIQTLLRTDLHYNGVVFSDDMQMHAISKNYGLEHSIELCINAGVDVLMFANNVTAGEPIITATELHAIVKKLVLENKISVERIRQAYTRIMAMKLKK